MLFNILSTLLSQPLATANQDRPRHHAIERMIRELSQPFCYFSHPTDQIGFEGCPKATIVTYDGAFVTAYGELSFYAGLHHKLVPIHHRVKTFYHGYIPVLEFTTERNGLKYHFEAFCTPPGLKATMDPVTFIQCKVTNMGPTEIKSQFGANFGATDSMVNADPKNPGFLDQRKTLNDALGAQRSSHWNTDQFMNEPLFQQSPLHAIAVKNEVEVNGHLVFMGPQEGIWGMPDYASQLKEASVEYKVDLMPGKSTELRFKLPDIPVELSHKNTIRTIEQSHYADYREKTIEYWRNRIDGDLHLSVDDPKVMNTFKTSLVNDLISTEVNQDGNTYQRVNKIQYDYMWIRDSAFIVRNYDLLGDFALAKKILHDFLVWKNGKPVEFFQPGAPQPKGARLSVQDDYWGEVLWAFGAYIRTSQDHQLLRQIYPLLEPHVELFLKKVATDPKGLWPVAGPYDNEVINGHYTGHSFWALLGLRNAVEMANMMHRPQDAKRWHKVYTQYRTHFLNLLRNLVKDSQNYIPPGMDSVDAGNDWDNASGGLFPFGVLKPTDPMATSTLRMVRNYNYREGIICYGGNAWVAKQAVMKGQIPNQGDLHDYEIFYVTEGNTILEKQEKVVKDLYSILVHTGSTNGGFETSIAPWSDRDPGGNFPPHGWFAARYMEQVRDCLVREDPRTQTLHLASVLAPEWVLPNRTVSVENAPTYFGRVSYKLECKANGATLHLQNKWLKGMTPHKIIFHFPWYLSVSSATADGTQLKVGKNQIEVPLDAKVVEIHWNWLSHPNLSYQEGVKRFLSKYYLRPPLTNYDFLFPHRKANQASQ